MQKLFVLIAVVLAGSLATPTPSFAQQQLESDAGVITMVATVQAIDVSNQLLTVVGPAGNVVVVKATPEVLGTVKLKDRITISFANEVATALRKADGPPINRDNAIAREEEAGMNMNPATEAEQTWTEAAPGGVTQLDTIELTATVATIDYANRVVTVKSPGGSTRTIMVDPSVPGLIAIKPGDRVVLLITRAVAITVTPA